MDCLKEEVAFAEFCAKHISCDIRECPCASICEAEQGFCQTIVDKMRGGEELAEQDVDVIEFWTDDRLWKKNDCVPKNSQEPCPNLDECNERPDGQAICTVLLRKLGRYEANGYGILEARVQEVIVRDMSQSLIDWHAGEGLRYYAEKPTIPVGQPDVLLLGETSKTLYVIELKVGSAKREHVGQLASYVGWYRQHPEQCPERCTDVKGILVAEDFDNRTLYALRACHNLEARRFYLHAEIKFVDS